MIQGFLFLSVVYFNDPVLTKSGNKVAPEALLSALEDVHRECDDVKEIFKAGV